MASDVDLVILSPRAEKLAAAACRAAAGAICDAPLDVEFNDYVSIGFTWP